MTRWDNSERAISAVFSVLLLIIITCVAAIFLYDFVINIVTNAADNASVDLFSVHIDNVSINNTCMTVYVGNRLNQAVHILKAYVNEVPSTILNTSDSGILIPSNSTGILYLNGSYTAGCQFDIKLVCDSGYAILTTTRSP
jgi:hypothetical protein